MSSPASDHGDVVLREMTLADVPAGLRLSRASGWNQTADDWRFMVEANPGRFVVAERGTAVIGTGGASCYGKRLAWVCMILVDAGARAQGIGGRIVTAVLERVADIPTLGLDATASGKAVYERLGFVASSGLARVGGKATDVAAGATAGVDTRPIVESDLDTILSLDPEAFGADRSRAIRWAHAQAPGLAWCVTQRGAISGYCFGRAGDRAAHIGPVVAQDVAGARALVARAATAATGDVILDVPSCGADWVDALAAMGLREQRPFTRMCRAGGRRAGYPELTFAVFGPELG